MPLHRAALALIALVSIAQVPPKPARTEMVAMRDGVRLATDVYLPDGSGPWPAIAHPNSFAPVDSYEGAPVAHVTLHASASHASRLILPVVPLADQ